MDLRFQRCELLFGAEDFAKIQKAKILILGVGGVGSYALDCLYRSGVSDITIIDYDRFDETNQNRQIGSEAVGELKVEVLKKLYPTITPINQKMDINPMTGMIKKVILDIHLPAGFPEKYKAAIIRSADQCAVKKHMIEPPEFEINTIIPA